MAGKLNTRYKFLLSKLEMMIMQVLVISVLMKQWFKTFCKFHVQKIWIILAASHYWSYLVSDNDLINYFLINLWYLPIPTLTQTLNCTYTRNLKFTSTPWRLLSLPVRNKSFYYNLFTLVCRKKWYYLKILISGTIW